MTTLEGPTWHLVRGVAIPDGTTISARFVGGTVSGSAGVNRYRADYTLDGEALRIGPAAATRMAGSDAANRAERDVLALLERVRSARLDDASGLALLDADGQELLGFEAAPAVGDALTGRWAVRLIRRGDAMVPPSAEAPVLAFTADGRVSGTAGINRVNGPARLDGDRLHLGPLMTTRMGGDPERMDEEAALLQALDAVASIRDDGGELTLLDADGEPQVMLTRADAG